jgi:methyl-accepting chemotaxis protein
MLESGLAMKFKMTISFRLLFGFGLLCLLIVALGLFATSTMSKVNVTTQNLINKVIPNVSKAQQMKLMATQLRVYESDYIRAYPQGAGDEIEKNMTVSTAALKTIVEEYLKSAATEQSKQAIQKFDTDFSAYLSQHDTIIQSMKSKNVKGAQLLYEQYSLRFYNNIQESLSALIDVSEKEANTAGTDNQAKYDEGYQIILYSIIVIVIFAILLSLLTTRSILKPIRKINRVLKDLAEAKGDLSVRIAIRSGDEIEKMGNYLNKVLETIERMVTSIRVSTKEVSASSQEIQVKCTQLHSSSEEITTAITHLSDTAILQTEHTQNSQSQVSDYSERLEKVAVYAQNTYDVALEANEGSMRGSEQLLSVIEQMDHIKRQNDITRETMVYFQQLLLRINDMNQMIRNISGQTNVLALNAGIEAARAGVHGKGFAVVASEVGKLANATKSSSEQIVDLLDDIQTEMNKVTEQFQQSSEYIVTGGLQMEKMRETFNLIREQNKTVMTIGEQTKEEAGQMVATIHTIVEVFSQLGKLSDEQSSTSQQVAGEAQQQLSSNQSIVALTRDLSQQASVLHQLVEMFHVNEK